ncbi:MAG: YiiD C-terminal domain-containing protein [Deltaproteobacteria bacterium]|nr:YiiD C-terminal domain-containing protein [Deltaproteobacteria bacterium]
MSLPIGVVKELIENKVAFLERMKLQAQELRPGYVKLFAPLSGNENHIGGVYAGALFTLAEIPGGALFYTSFDETKFYPVVKEMLITFLRPARTDVSIEISLSEEEINRITAEAEEKGKADFVLEGQIKDATDRIVARSRGVYQIRSIEGALFEMK